MLDAEEEGVRNTQLTSPRLVDLVGFFLQININRRITPIACWDSEEGVSETTHQTSPHMR